MRRLILILAVLHSGTASAQGVFPSFAGLSKDAADALYLPLTGGTLSDDLTLEGQLYIKENTTCTPVADRGCITTKSDNGLYFTTGDGDELQVLTGGSSTAQMHQTRNTTAFVINAADDVHVYHSGVTPIIGSELNNWTFDAGGEGTPHAITAIADYDGTWIEVTTGTPHGLAPGDIVSQSNLANVAYEGVFFVQAVPDTTHYRVIATFTASDTGTMDQAATLIAGAGAGGSYTVIWWCSASAESANHIFDVSVYKGATLIPGTEMRRKFSSTDFGVTSGGGRVTIVEGDRISFALANVGASGNIIRRNLTLLVERN